MITIDGKEYDPETFEGEAKVHFEQVMAIREQLVSRAMVMPPLLRRP